MEDLYTGKSVRREGRNFQVERLQYNKNNLKTPQFWIIRSIFELGLNNEVYNGCLLE